jgi:hypothetical protein
VTISNAEGAGPKFSNDLLATWDPGQKVHGLIEVKGKVGWVDSEEHVHYTAPQSLMTRPSPF